MHLSIVSITLALTLLQLVAGAPVESDGSGPDFWRRANKKTSKGLSSTSTRSSTTSRSTTTSTGTSSTSTKTSSTSSTSTSSAKTSTTPTSSSSNGTVNSATSTSSTNGTSTNTPTGSTSSSSASPTGSSCPNIQSITSGKGKRAPVQHPPGKSDVNLFHGTSEKKDADILAGPIDLSKIKDGDLHSTAVSGVDGGFYLTDSLMAAAQFACRNDQGPQVWVLEYEWKGASLPVKDYSAGPEFKAFLDYEKHKDAPTRNEALDKVMKDNAMITGPMNAAGADDFLGADFQQYAVIKQDAANNNLKWVKTYTVNCNAIPIGHELNEAMYTAGQKSSSDFAKMSQYATTCEGKYDWKKAVN